MREMVCDGAITSDLQQQLHEPSYHDYSYQRFAAGLHWVLINNPGTSCREM